MKKRFQLSSGMKNAAKISSGTVLGQIISIVSLPFITRIYGAEVMGIWAVINAIASLMNTVSDLGMTQCIMIKDEKDILRTYSAISLVVVLMCIPLSLVAAAYCLLIRHDSLVVTGWIVLFALVYAVTLQFGQVSYTWLNKNKEYSALMKNPLVNYGTMAVSTIVLGLLGFKTYGYYIGVTIGQVLTLLHMRRYLPKKISKPSLEEVRRVIQENRIFVKYQMPTNVATQMREQIPNLLISGLFGDTVLGYFSISQKLLNIPISFIGQSLGKVFYQKLAELRSKGEDLAFFIYRNLTRALKLAFIPMALLAAYGDAAVVMFFGAGYSIGGVIVRIVVFRSFFTFVSACTQGMDIVLGKQKYSLITCLSQTVLICMSIVLTHLVTDNVYVCAGAMTVCFILVQIMYFCAIFKTVGLGAGRYLKNILPALVGVFVCAFALRYAFIWLTQATGWGFFEYLAGFLVQI